MSTKIVTVELSKPLPNTIEGAENYDSVWAIAMREGVPLGVTVIDNGHMPVSQEFLRSEIVRQMNWTLTSGKDFRDKAQFEKPLPPEFAEEPELARLLPTMKPIVGQTHFLSIIVCTYDRPDDLRRCLQNLIKLEAGKHRFELIVVDNHPSSGKIAPIVKEFTGVRYEPEPRQGVSYARNKGLRASRGDIVAVVDDDVVVTSGWLRRILAPFSDERVMCVSGLVLPLELESDSQEMFEKYGGLGRGYVPRVFGSEFFNTKHVVQSWELGGTANVAIRKSVIRETGMFDETLGTGSPTGEGEAIYMFYRILKLGHLCYYEPAAYVWHKHRNSMKALRKQLYGYLKGQVSYQLRCLISDRDKRVYHKLFYDLPLWYAKRIYRILRGREKYPMQLVMVEMAGLAMGAPAFIKSNRMHRELNGAGTNPIRPELVDI